MPSAAEDHDNASPASAEVDTAPLLRLENINRTFDDGAVVALAEIHLSIEAGDCVAIIGKSGSGKSTLINILCGCDRATSGTIYWRGKPIEKSGEWRRLRASEIGIVFQEFNLLPALTASENIEVALMERGLGARDRRSRATELLARVGLEHRMHQRPANLSGGERQRVAIARALANDPALLLADEPTGSLDSASAASIMDLLLDIQEAQGAALVLVTHDEGLASRCRRRVAMRDGRIAAGDRQSRPASRPLRTRAGATLC